MVYTGTPRLVKTVITTDISTEFARTVKKSCRPDDDTTDSTSSLMLISCLRLVTSILSIGQ